MTTNNQNLKDETKNKIHSLPKRQERVMMIERVMNISRYIYSSPAPAITTVRGLDGRADARKEEDK